MIKSEFMKKDKDFSISSGNVFADLGLLNPEERLAKAELARQINNLIDKKKRTQKGFTQVQIAELFDIDQSKISLLAEGKLAEFSLEKLFKFLNLLGQNITIKVSKAQAARRAYVAVDLPTIKKTSLKKRSHDAPNHVAIQAKKRKTR